MPASGRWCSRGNSIGLVILCVLVAGTVVFHFLFDAWEQRLSRLEDTVHQLATVVATSEQKVLALERHAAFQQSQGISAPAIDSGEAQKNSQCLNLGEFASLKSLGSQGWFADVQEAELDPGFLGWSGGFETGSLYAYLRHAGTLKMKVSNAHSAKEPQNWVKVWLNDELVAVVGPDQHMKLCLDVLPGDILVVKEKYGKIWLRNVDLQCSPASPAYLPDQAKHDPKLCSAGQRVRWKSRVCNSETWYEGAIERILNHTRAVVKMRIVKTSPGSVASKTIQVHSAGELFVVDMDNGAKQPQPCLGFAGVEREKIGIVVVANKQFLDSYSLHIKSQRCFASKHGYDFWILKPGSYEACDDFVGNVFFEKHCIVSEFLKQRQPLYVAVVMDADTMAVVLERGVEQWLLIKADLMFYERDFQNEIAAGNYIARNTPAARSFLMKWARFQFRQPPGFSSADNGAIHLHLVETLKLEGADVCARLYSDLTATVENLNPYFKFVACTLKLLGSPRTWNLTGVEGTIAVWPRLSFFVVDGFVFNRKYNDLEGPVFHHGIKKKDEAAKQYLSFDHCVLNSGSFAVNTGEIGRLAAGFANGKKDLFKGSTACLRSMSCQPAASREGSRPL